MGLLKALNPFSFIGNIVDGVKEYAIEHKRQKGKKQEFTYEIQKLEHDVKKAQVATQLEMAKKGQAIDFDLDMQSMKNMEKSWKDEFILILLSTPMIMAFHPDTATYALNGFKIIAKMPYWYIGLFVGIVIVIYGLRGLFEKYLSAKKSNLNLLKK